MMKRKVLLLGATGSIGKQSLDIFKKYVDSFELTSCSGFNNKEALKEILHTFPSIGTVYCSFEVLSYLKNDYPKVQFYSEKDGLESFLNHCDFDLMVNALVGFIGLKPTLYAIEHDKELALANKESIVVGGELINSLLLKHPSAHLYPIDSEHVAITKCFMGRKKEDVESLILTASGGPFRDLTRDELKNVTLQEALKHPSWSMGAKITIDSATMVNKGFEIIEAHYLFNFPEDKIKVLLHDESYIHSLIEMKDGSFVADIGPHDMRIPISFALFNLNYERTPVPRLALDTIGSLHFRKLDEARYPALNLARFALKEKGSLPCVLNAANEAANLAFRENKLPFNKIEEVIENVMNSHRIIDHPTYEDLCYVHKISLEAAQEYIKGAK